MLEGGGGPDNYGGCNQLQAFRLLLHIRGNPCVSESVSEAETTFVMSQFNHRFTVGLLASCLHFVFLFVCFVFTFWILVFSSGK